MVRIAQRAVNAAAAVVLIPSQEFRLIINVQQPLISPLVLQDKFSAQPKLITTAFDALSQFAHCGEVNLSPFSPEDSFRAAAGFACCSPLAGSLSLCLIRRSIPKQYSATAPLTCNYYPNFKRKSERRQLQCPEMDSLSHGRERSSILSPVPEKLILSPEKSWMKFSFTTSNATKRIA
jgi:hypothetical protein